MAHLAGGISWITVAKNVPLLAGLTKKLRSVAWEQRDEFCDREYDRRATMAISVGGAFDAVMDQLKAAGKVE